ncbi:MAG: phytanoyl-CoA dioxygenase family protein [Armatimonadetes bacterium]|nr:phytanoyl-CoA dioxygenase family protein [Armatimonadota bacterium]
MAHYIGRYGFAVVPGVLDAETADRLIAALDAVPEGDGVRRRGGVYAIRNLLRDVPAIGALARSAAVRALVAPHLGPDAFPVRGILFDKTPDANWNVVWHQDLSIAVRERREVPGFGPWSRKAGVPHVQPPAALLERMLTVRLHLDDCGEDNGPLRVLPGSHRHGRLDAEAIQEWRARVPEVTCPVPRGGALLMRPLLLHASSDAQTPRHRRVIHLEFAAEGLPGGLEWYNGT